MKISDLTHPEITKQLSKKIFSLETSINNYCTKIRTTTERNMRNLAIYNIAIRLVIELNRIRQWLKESNDMLGWCSRNIFELNLTLRYILQSENNVNIWMWQRFSDEIQILEGILGSVKNMNHRAVTILTNRINEIKKKTKENKIVLSNHVPISKLATKVGLQSEYRAFFKLYSKYVHPSSWNLNSLPEQVNSNELKNSLLVLAYDYGFDIYKIIQNEFDKQT